MEGKDKGPARSNFRNFFLRGLAILLPTVLTIWILIAAYGFVRDRIAQPINGLVKRTIVAATPWPAVSEDLAILPQTLPMDQRQLWLQRLTPEQRDAWEASQRP